MSDKIRSSRQKLIVGVQAQESSRGLLEISSHIAHRLDLAMHVVHVVEHMVDIDSKYAELLGSFDLSQLTEEVWGDELLNTEHKIQNLLESLPDHVDVETRIMRSDNPAQALMAEASAQHGAMIVVGLSNYIYSLIPRGLSVVLKLMANSSVPVIVVRHESQLKFGQTALRVLISDDLRPSSLRVLLEGIKFASGLGRIEVLHLHIVEPSVTSLVTHLAETGETKHMSISDIPAFWAEAILNMERKLFDRSQAARSIGEKAIVRYEARVVSGHPTHEISKFVSDFSPDIAVFGRSPEAQQRTFGVGRVPFSALLAGCSVVMVIP